MIALQQAPVTVGELTAYERNIIAALKDGCYLAELTGRVYLCDNRLPAYKRLVPVAILTNLLAAGLVIEAQGSVWQIRLDSERMVNDETQITDK